MDDRLKRARDAWLARIAARTEQGLLPLHILTIVRLHGPADEPDPFNPPSRTRVPIRAVVFAEDTALGCRGSWENGTWGPEPSRETAAFASARTPSIIGAYAAAAKLVGAPAPEMSYSGSASFYSLWARTERAAIFAVDLQLAEASPGAGHSPEEAAKAFEALLSVSQRACPGAGRSLVRSFPWEAGKYWRIGDAILAAASDQLSNEQEAAFIDDAVPAAPTRSGSNRI